MEWDLVPVFRAEWLVVSRRWQVYAVRSLFVAALLVNLGLVWWRCVAVQPFLSVRAQANVGQIFFVAIAGTQLALVLLAAPVATADAICLDRARGTLEQLLATDLSDAEIVLGKLAARLLPILAMVACSLPVLALGSLLGGIDPDVLWGVFLITLGCALAGGAVGLALSLWVSQMHEALLASYAFFSLWVLAYPIWAGFRAIWVGGLFTVSPPIWLAYTNPFWLAFAAYLPRGTLPLMPAIRVDRSDHLRFLGGAALLTCGLVLLVTHRVRPTTLGWAGRGGGSTWGRLGGRATQGPAPEQNPVLWRTWNFGRSSRWARVVWTLYAVMTGMFSLAVVVHNVGGTRPMVRGLFSPALNALQVATGLMLLSVSSATALGEERARQRLDVLLSTPLSTRAVLTGLWWGTYRIVPWLTLAPGLVALSLAWQNPARWPGVAFLVSLILAQGAALTSLGLALATWVSRLGRSVALTVTAYALVAVGWVFVVVVVLFQNNGTVSIGIAMAMASPLMGALLSTVALVDTGTPPWAAITTGVIGWTAAYLTLAFVLSHITLATFDRCVGRISEGAGSVRGSGWRTPSAAAPRGADGASCGRRPR